MSTQGSNQGCGIPFTDGDTGTRQFIKMDSYNGGAEVKIGEVPTTPEGELSPDMTFSIPADALHFLAESIQRMRGVGEPWDDNDDEDDES